MADYIQISCIRPDGVDQDYRIDEVGGVNPDGGRWRISIDRAIEGMDCGRWKFFTRVNGRRADVIKRKSTAGRWYLTTVADGYVTNNLSSLPRCP